jgi:hypothetical protein
VLYAQKRAVEKKLAQLDHAEKIDTLDDLFKPGSES